VWVVSETQFIFYHSLIIIITIITVIANCMEVHMNRWNDEDDDHDACEDDRYDECGGRCSGSGGNYI